MEPDRIAGSGPPDSADSRDRKSDAIGVDPRGRSSIGENFRRAKMEVKEVSEWINGTAWDMETGRCWAKKVDRATSVWWGQNFLL